MDYILSAISDLFVGNGLIIVLADIIVGLFIKGSFSKIPNKFIPYINIVLSLILGFVIPGTFEDRDVVSKVILLIFLGFASVGVYEALCTIFKERFSIDIKKILAKYSLGSNEVIESNSITEEDPQIINDDGEETNTVTNNSDEN